jgi:outer membrane protein assembly factor BamB/TolA-binding protein
MTPKELLTKLESLGSIDKKALRKIRIQVEDTSRTVKPSAMLSYLVRKDQLTEEQARQLMRGETPKVTSRKNTEDLMVDVLDDEPNVADLNRTRPDRGRRESPGRIEEVLQTPTPIIDEYAAPAIPDGPDGFDDFGSAATVAEGESIIPTFTGKKSNPNQWNSRWPYIGFGVLGFLLLVGAFLAMTIGRLKPDAMYDEARGHFENGSYQAAIKAYDDYLENFPSHKSAKEGEARRLQCLLLDSYESKLWDETLKRAELKLPEFAKDEEADIDLIRPDLAVILTGSLSELSRSMLKDQELSAMQANMEKARRYKKLVDDPYFVTGTSRRLASIKTNIETIDNNLRTIDGFIQKEQDYTSALENIASLGQEGKTDEAFKTFKTLTQKYGDLGAREELRTAMVSISKLESELVKPAEFNVEPKSTFAPTSIERTIVMGAVVGDKEEGLMGDVVPTLVDGAVYGINAGSGEIAWRRFVGLAASIQPQMIDEETVLVCDADTNQVMKLKTSNGDLIWRSVIGEKFFKPALSPEKMVVTTVSGKIIRLDPNNGQVIAAAQLPQGANTHSFVAEQDPLVYQTGIYSNLYVLGTDDMMCKEVFYLGHYDGSISVPPFIFNGYLVVLVNGGDFCDMQVLKTNENGLELELVQVRRITNSPVTQHMQRYGKNLLVVSDNGQMVILQYNQGDEIAPITRFASDSFENESGQPTFIEAEGSNLWVCGNGANYYKVKRNLGKFELKILKNGDDSFVAPCKKLDDKLFHVRKRASSGMVSASLVDALTLEPIWRNDFGGELAGSVVDANGRLMAISNQGDLFEVNNAAEGSGYVPYSAKASTVVESLRFADSFNLDDNNFVSVGGLGSKEYVTVSDGDLKLQTLSAPSNRPACPPIAVNGQLLVANSNGQVAVVDPRTGAMVGEAFQPPIKPAKKVRWIRPVQVSDTEVAVATEASDATSSALYLLEIQDGRAVVAKSTLESNGTFVGKLAVDNGFVFAADRIDNADAIIKFDVASGAETARVPLDDGLVVDGPWQTDKGLLVQLDSDQMVLLDSNLNQKWIRKIGNQRFACPPTSIAGRMALVLQSGRIIFIDDETGKETDVIDLGQPIVHAPTFANGKVYFSGMDGTVHVLNASPQ